MATLRAILAPLAAPVAIAAALTGCGASESTLDPVAAAASRTAGAGSSKVALSGSIQGGGLPGPASFTATGAVDHRARRGRLSLDLSRSAALAGGGRISPADLRGEQLFVGLVLYMRLPLLEKALPGGKEWLKVDLGKAGRAQGVDVGQLSQLGQNDPSQYLEYLRATSGKTTRVGTEPVRGVDTTRYRATVDLDRYPRLAPPPRRREARAAVDALIRLTGTRTIPTEVWIDAKGLVRRVAIRFALRAAPASAGRARFALRMEFFAFGTRVEVEPPPASEVLDATKLAAERRSRSGARVKAAPRT